MGENRWFSDETPMTGSREAALMAQCDDLRVTGETTIGWCALTPTNERLDAEGRPSDEDMGPVSAPDPTAPLRRVFDDPQVCALREHLRAANGIAGLDILEPRETQRAARMFLRDGFVVVRDLLDAQMLDTMRQASARVLGDILAEPGAGGRKHLAESRRLPHRYSYGTASASRELLHLPQWAALVDLPTTTPILEAIFGGTEYFVVGAGGDVCLPGAIEYQALHADFREPYVIPPARLAQAQLLGLELTRLEGGGALDERSRQLLFERTPPIVTINFLMSDQTFENGPIRQIAGSQARPGRPPTQAEEPAWMRPSPVVGAPAGAGVFRDPRAWHGGTPNLSREIRAMPNVEYGAPWLDDRWFKTSMPHAIWTGLSDHAQRLCERIRTAPAAWPPALASCTPWPAAAPWPATEPRPASSGVPPGRGWAGTNPCTPPLRHPRPSYNEDPGPRFF